MRDSLRSSTKVLFRYFSVTRNTLFSGTTLALALIGPLAYAAEHYEVEAAKEMARLLKTSDTDGDKKITVLDRNTSFWLQGKDGSKREVTTPYFLSNLLQELKLAVDRKKTAIEGDHIFENPVQRISRSIRELYWDGLTRRVDPENLATALIDSKLAPAEWRYLYVPEKDERAYAAFSKVAAENPKLKVKVLKLPKNLRELDGKHGLLTLALEEEPKTGRFQGVPFVVPGGRFNEMYGWDSYFEALGLIVDGRKDLARAMVDNFTYEIENYGKILNANRSYYLNRSQPPFLSSMILSLAPGESKEWLERSLRAAVKEYFEVWQNPDRLTETGLSRYYGNGHGIPPEVEKGHFDYILKPAAKRLRISQTKLIERYNSGQLKDAALDDFFAQDRAVRESGHDTTYRWRVDGVDRAADFVTVDLNSLLYKYELDFAHLTKTYFGDRFLFEGRTMTSAEWLERAKKRKAKMVELLWDPEKKIFFDYNFKTKRRSDFVSATAYYPLWAGGPTNTHQLLPSEELRASAAALAKELETDGGLSSTAASSLKRYGDPKNLRQWDFPNGWAPHQMIAWVGLENIGMKPDRLIYKWLYSVTKNAAAYNGTVPEKLDVVARSHAVFAEYGNVGTEFSYITKEGFGWMNASYQVGLQKLPPKLRGELESLRPPEWIEF